MSRFVDLTVTESWRTVVDKIPLVGTKIVDKLTKPILDKIMQDKKLREYIKKETKHLIDGWIEDYKKEFPTGERKISLDKPSKYEPLATEKDVRGMDNDMINYEYTIDNKRYRVSTDGKTIRRVYVALYEYDRKSDKWYEEFSSLYAPAKDELAKMWKPIDDGEYLDE